MRMGGSVFMHACTRTHAHSCAEMHGRATWMHACVPGDATVLAFVQVLPACLHWHARKYARTHARTHARTRMSCCAHESSRPQGAWTSHLGNKQRRHQHQSRQRAQATRAPRPERGTQRGRRREIRLAAWLADRGSAEAGGAGFERGWGSGWV